MNILCRPGNQQDRDLILEYVDALTEPQIFKLVPITKKKSRASEDYYWRCIIRPLAEYIGYGRNEEEKLHNELLYMFSFKWTTGLDGHPMREVIRSTDKRFTTQWQQKYYEEIRTWAADFHGFVIALPNEDLDAPIDPKFNNLLNR